MTDIALAYDPNLGGWDISLDGADLAQDDCLETAILLSLYCDRRALDDDTIPGGSADRRGWWGDRVAPLERPSQGAGSDPDRYGSRLWLLWQETQHASLLPEVQAILQEALAWLVEDGWASAMDIAVSFPRRAMLAFTVSLTRTSGPVSYTQQVAWGPS